MASWGLLTCDLSPIRVTLGLQDADGGDRRSRPVRRRWHRRRWREQILAHLALDRAGVPPRATVGQPPPAALARPAVASPFDDAGRRMTDGLGHPEPRRHDQRDHQPGRQEPAPPLARVGGRDGRLDGLIGERRAQRLQQRPIPRPGRPRRIPRPSAQRLRQPSLQPTRSGGGYPARLRHWYWI
jgi:hypothetical protein